MLGTRIHLKHPRFLARTPRSWILNSKGRWDKVRWLNPSFSWKPIEMGHSNDTSAKTLIREWIVSSNFLQPFFCVWKIDGWWGPIYPPLYHSWDEWWVASHFARASMFNHVSVWYDQFCWHSRFCFCFWWSTPLKLKHTNQNQWISNFKSLFRRSNSYTIPIFDLVVRKAVFAEMHRCGKGRCWSVFFFLCLGKQSRGPFHMTMQDFICRVNPPKFNSFHVKYYNP